MIRRQPRSTRADTPVPYTTLCRSRLSGVTQRAVAGVRIDLLGSRESTWTESPVPRPSFSICNSRGFIWSQQGVLAQRRVLSGNTSLKVDSPFRSRHLNCFIRCKQRVIAQRSVLSRNATLKDDSPFRFRNLNCFIQCTQLVIAQRARKHTH